MRTQIDGSGVMGNHNDRVYDNLLGKINERFKSIHGPLFTTNTDRLFDIYLVNFPEDQRQYHNCHACKNFIKKFGGLVTIDKMGHTSSAIWNTEIDHDLYSKSIKAMQEYVSSQKVTGVFLSSEKVWGQPVTGQWRHFYIEPDWSKKYPFMHHGFSKNSGQAMAEKKDDFKNVIRALKAFSIEHLNEALRLLKSEALYRSEKVIGPVQWLCDLYGAINNGKNKTNIIWSAVATAPAGFCHIRSSMAGTLLEDIASGMNFDQVSQRFAEKMHPLRYQRPQAAPRVGNIEQAEKLVEKLGIASSLERRFARLDEVQALWKPSRIEPESRSGVFGHLKAKKTGPIVVPPMDITWVKFSEKILPDAKQIKVKVPYNGDFIALVTATNGDAPPILQWDNPERRNPVSWYRYACWSNAEDWSLSPNAWCDVTAVCLYPDAWFDAKSNYGNESMFILEGCVDLRDSSLALFPEMLKSDIHEIRSTIEAFSKSRELTGMNEASACGICAIGSHIRINGIEYRIDRWD